MGAGTQAGPGNIQLFAQAGAHFQAYWQFFSINIYVCTELEQAHALLYVKKKSISFHVGNT